jgi:hypothetical protein
MPGPRDYTQATRAALVDLAGGTCYFPECEERLIKFLDDLAVHRLPHRTYPRREGGQPSRPRNDGRAEERRSFRNLILLCKPHHDLVDKRHAENYSVADLESWKTACEGRTRGGLENLGMISEHELEDLLREAAITIVQSTLQLGGQGGNAPGAGGGGGGVLGSGTGGPGGPGGNIILDGAPGTAPGAGGGGAGAVGRGNFGAEGGGGGEIASAVLDADLLYEASRSCR